MRRSFASNDLIQLPKLSVSGAVALGTQLVTVARSAQGLSPTLTKALGRVETTCLCLRTTAMDRIPSAEIVDSPAVTHADRVIDSAWSGTYHWCVGWSKLPLEQNAVNVATALVLLGTLFPDGLKFTQLPYGLEWTESQARLDRIDTDKLETKFDALHGRAFLDTVRAAHAAYGQVLGMSKVKAPEPPSPQARKPLDDFLAALRTYVLRVSAHGDADDPASMALAQSLLAPLMAWKTPSAEKATPETPTPTPKADPLY